VQAPTASLAGAPHATRPCPPAWVGRGAHVLVPAPGRRWLSEALRPSALVGLAFCGSVHASPAPQENLRASQEQSAVDIKHWGGGDEVICFILLVGGLCRRPPPHAPSPPPVQSAVGWAGHAPHPCGSDPARHALHSPGDAGLGVPWALAPCPNVSRCEPAAAARTRQAGAGAPLGPPPTVRRSPPPHHSRSRAFTAIPHASFWRLIFDRDLITGAARSAAPGRPIRAAVHHCKPFCVAGSLSSDDPVARGRAASAMG
jgi:hypothetical protein